MTVKQLYDKLKSEEFLDPHSGSVAYNYFIFPYPANQEYEIRDQIVEFKKNLIRPNTFADVLCINLYEEFCEFLKSKEMDDKPLLDFLMDQEEEDPDMAATVNDYLMNIVTDTTDDGFIAHIARKINEHVAIVDDKIRPYIFIHGIGSIYPYLRVNQFLSIFEDFNSPDKYKIIVFYPGHADGNYFKLFDELADKHSYRAVKLITNLQ